MENGLFGVSAVTFENLRSITSSCTNEFEERVCELAMLADAVASGVSALSSEGMSLYDAMTALTEELDLFADSEKTESYALTDRYCKAFRGSIRDLDKLVFSELLCEKLKDRGYSVTERNFLVSEDCESLIAYVRSTLTDEAYDVFSQELDDPRILYVGNTREALRSVADGECGYCIVPFEEKGGARVLGVFSAIASFDLKIVGVTPVFGPEGTADVKYALVSRGFRELSRTEDDDFYLELLISSDSRMSLGGLLSTAESFGYSAYNIGSVEYELDGERISAVSVALRDGGRDFSAFLMLLTAFADDYTAIGFYKNIE